MGKIGSERQFPKNHQKYKNWSDLLFYDLNGRNQVWESDYYDEIGSLSTFGFLAIFSI